MSVVPIMVSDGRRVSAESGDERKKAAALSAIAETRRAPKVMATSPSCWAAQQRGGTPPFAPERYVTPHDEAAQPSRQWGELSIV